MTSTLRSTAILEQLDRLEAAVGRPLEVLASTGSTNDDARRLARSGAPHGAVVFAEEQRAGRGRSGHSWHSPPGENLYLSMVCRPRLEPAALATLALAVGLAVARTVDAVLGEGALIKWPNDVYVGGRKIAGVLVEATSSREGTLAIVGVGLNVLTTDFPEELAAIATSLAAAGAPRERLDRNAVAARLLFEMDLAVRDLEADGLPRLIAAINQRDYLLNRQVSVNGEHGTAIGIDHAGRLELRRPDGSIHRVVAGEVAIRS